MKCLLRDDLSCMHKKHQANSHERQDPVQNSGEYPLAGFSMIRVQSMHFLSCTIILQLNHIIR
jgi:hypothetical protein